MVPKAQVWVQGRRRAWAASAGGNAPRQAKGVARADLCGMRATRGAFYGCRQGPPYVVWAWRMYLALWWTRRAGGGGRGSLALQALHQLRCQAMTTRAPALVYCTRYGHGKVQQHIKGPSVWPGLGPPTVRFQRRHSARPRDACRAGARPRRPHIATARRRPLEVCGES